MNTRIENFTIYSDIVYPDLISDRREFKKVREISENEKNELIGKLNVANKYLVCVCGIYLYQHDYSLYECKRV